MVVIPLLLERLELEGCIKRNDAFTVRVVQLQSRACAGEASHRLSHFCILEVCRQDLHREYCLTT